MIERDERLLENKLELTKERTMDLPPKELWRPFPIV